jgi:hypothetical protein
MAAEREAWLVRHFEVLEHEDVPDLWERIVARSDTELNADALGGRRRHWLPLTAAAAAVLVLVAVGLALWLRDDPRRVDTPPSGSSNTVQVIAGDGEQSTITPTAIAGTVSFDITNPTDHYRAIEVRRLLAGATLEDVQAEAARYIEDVNATPRDGILSEPLLGVVGGPHDHYATAMPLTAGDYVVIVSTVDSTFAPTPADGHEVRLLTVAPGDTGTAPAATLAFDRMAQDYLIGPTTAPRGTATIHVANTAGGPFELAIKELRPDATQHDFDLWQLATPDPAHTDWSTAPVTAFRIIYAGAAQQTITIDLHGGDLHVEAPAVLGQGTPSSGIWVTIE